jgi:hypothetical protein
MPTRTENTKQTTDAARKRQTIQPVGQDLVLLQEQIPSLTQSVQRAIWDPGHASPADILALQHAAGNHAVSHLIQTKLTVGPAGDRYEQEADRVAEQVLTMPLPSPARRGAGGEVQRQEEEELQAKPVAATITPLVQRQEEEDLQAKPLVQRQDEEELQAKRWVQRQDEEELQAKRWVQRQDEEELQAKPLVQRQDEEELQAKPIVRRQADGGFEAGPELEGRLAARKGSGNPLSQETRAFMEPRLGADFSGVRVHSGSEAGQMSKELKAQAFTHGQDIYLGAGRYDPDTDAGKRLLAHELTHVVQQTGTEQARIQRWPWGKKKKKEEGFAIVRTEGPSGQVGKPMEPKVDVSYSTPSHDPVVFFGNAEWTDHFLKWAVDKGYAKDISRPVIEVFVEANRRRIDADTLTRQEALDFADDVLGPRASDPQVQQIIASRSGEGGGLESLRSKLATDQAFEEKPYGGRKILGGKATKLYYKVLDLFNGYRTWLGTPEGQADATRPLTAAPPTAAPLPHATRLAIGGHRPEQPSGPAPRKLPPPPVPSREGRPQLPERRPLPAPPGSWTRGTKMSTGPVDPRLNTRQMAILRNVQARAERESAKNVEKAKAKLRQCDILEDDLDQTLARLIDYIRKAPTTITFTPSHSEFALYERLGGRTPIWAKPISGLAGEEREAHMRHLKRRQEVEEKYFGTQDYPLESGRKLDRPGYAAANVGEAVSGAAEQYGSSYLVLKEQVKERSTYSHKDTFAASEAIENIGTLAHLEGVVADMNVEKIKTLLSFISGEKDPRGLGENEYIEVHIHGPVEWRRDVAKVVIDRATVPEGSLLEKHLLRFAKSYDLQVEYYNFANWKKIALDRGIKAANVAEAPKSLQEREVKIGGPELRQPGTMIKIAVDQTAKTVAIEKPTKEEPGSPVKAAPAGTVRTLAQRLEKDIKFGPQTS